MEYQATRPSGTRSSTPASCRSFTWWLTVGCVSSSSAASRPTSARPSGLSWISPRMRIRVGSVSRRMPVPAPSALIDGSLCAPGSRSAGLGDMLAGIRHTGGMRAHWSPLAVVYLVLSVGGLIGTWTFNGLAIAGMRDYLGDLLTSGPSVSSITVDLLVVAVAGSIFIIVEARRLGMRFGWLYSWDRPSRRSRSRSRCSSRCGSGGVMPGHPLQRMPRGRRVTARCRRPATSCRASRSSCRPPMRPPSPRYPWSRRRSQGARARRCAPRPCRPRARP